ncbi:MAG: hypothetical protein H0T66_17920 [Geodermatophilaceae bacterium]|nr:hypothetical protein [Geodermatophilaceae bacterium]
MSTLAVWRHRRQLARSRRELDQAIRQAPSPAMRDELLVLRDRNDHMFR